MLLSCIVLHNLCIDLDDKAQKSWDLSYDPSTNKRQPREVACNMLHLTKCRRVADNSTNASLIRDGLKKKFWDEKHGTITM